MTVSVHTERRWLDYLVPHIILYSYVSASGEADENKQYMGFISEDKAKPITKVYAARGLAGYVIEVEGCDFDRVRKIHAEEVSKAKTRVQGVA